VEYLKVKVGDRVRRTRHTFTGDTVPYLGESFMNDLYGIQFRVAAVHLGDMVHLEVFAGAGGELSQGDVLAVPHGYFSAPYWYIVPPLILKVADAQGLGIAQRLVEEKHYLQRRVHQLARPMAYLVLNEHNAELMGAIIYSRPQCARAYGSPQDETPELGRWGNVNDVRTGRCKRTQWEVVNLARFYLVAGIQKRESRDYVPNAASIVVAQSLWRVCVDYLKVYPPAFFNEPWELKEAVSYCARDRFFCTLYLASAFQHIRTNASGLQTYSRPLRGLMPHEKKEVREASLVNGWARGHRAERSFEETMTRHPFMRRSWPRTQIQEHAA